MNRLIGLVVALGLVFAACGGGDDRVVVAAGTTLVDSGFLDAVVDSYVSDTGSDRPSVVARSSKEAIALGSSGDADLLITHEPVALYEFLTTHPAAVVTEPFSSRFVIVAPSAGSLDAGDAVGFFAAVAENEAVFVSRDDGSGTNARELAIWAQAGIDPTGEPWYITASAGMGATLLVASERAGSTLSELGAFLTVTGVVDLTAVELQDTSGLENPYQATVVDPGSSPGAMAFQEWLATDAGRAAIRQANLTLFGFEVYEVS